MSAPASRSETCTRATTAGCARSRRRKVPNIGLIGYLASFARINRFGFIETPYRKVDKGRVTDEIEYLAADDEDEYVIAQANARVDEQGNFLDERVLVRAGPRRDRLRRARRGRLHGRVAEADRVGRDRADPVPRARRRQPRPHGRQHAAPGRPAAARRPRPTSAPASRAARRATPATCCSPPTTVRCSTSPATPSSSTTRTDRPAPTHRLAKFRRSNQGTCINQKPLVDDRRAGRQGGRRARRRPVDPRTASSRSARTCWSRSCRGRVTTSRTRSCSRERLVKDDVLTSIHIEEHEIDARDTKLGAEEITRDIPNLSEDILKDLDERGHHPHRRRGRPGRHPRRQGHARRARPSSPPRSGCCARSSVRRPARCATPASRSRTARPARSSTCACSPATTATSCRPASTSWCGSTSPRSARSARATSSPAATATRA